MIGRPEWATDPRFGTRQGWVDHLEPVLVPGNPVRMSEAAAPPPERPPWLGEHTGDVLRAELGLGPAELGAQRDDGVIA